MKVTVSVPGKIFLMGEHAVVHGAPALLAAIDKRMYVTIASAQDTKTKSSLAIYTTGSDKYVRQIVEVVQKNLGIKKIPHITITIKSDISPGYHLGSSSALAVGVTGALMYYLKKIWNPSRINEVAYEAEKLKHGNPSGADNTAVTFGGLIWYRKELEFLKSIWSLPFKPHEVLRHFYLIDTGRPVESTGEMVMGLGERVKADRKKYHEIFYRNEVQTKRITVAIKEGNENELIDALRMGERTLEEMDVVSKKAIKIIRHIEKSGGAAKILGGGGKKAGVGFLLSYHPNYQKLKHAILAFHTEPIKVHLGEEGIRLEKK